LKKKNKKKMTNNIDKQLHAYLALIFNNEIVFLEFVIQVQTGIYMFIRHFNVYSGKIKLY